MPDSVTITISTGSRLHFGLLANGRPPSLSCDTPQFGGVGVMIDRPGFTIRATHAARDVLVCPPDLEQRIRRIVAAWQQQSPGNGPPPPVCVEVLEAIPSHAGLGSGTQLALAVAQALSLLGGNHDARAGEFAAWTGRGVRSALGVHGFREGGFLVEGGKTAPDHISPLVSRVPFPAEWRFLLVRPPHASGLSGEAETASFAKLAPMPESTTGHLCRIALMELVPSVVEADFERFGAALFDFGRQIGEYFAPVQGGIYAHPQMDRLARELQAEGIRGVAQTSWGPTLAIACPDETSARGLADDLASSPKWSACEFIVAPPLNQGASVETSGGG